MNAVHARDVRVQHGNGDPYDHGAGSARMLLMATEADRGRQGDTISRWCTAPAGAAVKHLAHTSSGEPHHRVLDWNGRKERTGLQKSGRIKTVMITM